MEIVDIPFLPIWKPLMVSGVKTHTCRSKQYGAPGDRFRKFGATFELTWVAKVPLSLVLDSYWKQEGCTSPEHFVQVWEEIHPGRGFVPSDKRWLHEFRKVKED